MSQWVAETLIATTLLMIAVLVLRRPVTERFGARVAYLLWLAPGLRMILPPLPEHWFPAANMNSALPVPDAAVMVVDVSGSAMIDAAAGGGVAWLALSLSVWLGGAALFFLWHWLSYRRFVTAALDNADWLDADAPVPVAASSAISSPVALGIFGRRVLVPADFAHRYDADEQRLALDHELAHHRRLDLPVNLAALAMLSLHWFNPIAHIAHRAFRLDQEAACDAIVLARADAGQRLAYGTALYKSATGAMPLAVCALGDASQLKSRLRLIVSGEASGAWMRCGSALTAVIVMMGLVITASSRVAGVAVDPVAELAPVTEPRTMAATAEPVEVAVGTEPVPAVIAPAVRKDQRTQIVAEQAWPAPPPPPPAPAAAPTPHPPLQDPITPPSPPAPIAHTAPATAISTITLDRTCKRGHEAVATHAEAVAANTHRVSVSVCRKRIAIDARVATLHGLNAARESVTMSHALMAAHKAEILKDLDIQIRRLKAGQDTLY